MLSLLAVASTTRGSGMMGGGLGGKSPGKSGNDSVSSPGFTKIEPCVVRFSRGISRKASMIAEVPRVDAFLIAFFALALVMQVRINNAGVVLPVVLPSQARDPSRLLPAQL